MKHVNHMLAMKRQRWDMLVSCQPWDIKDKVIYKDLCAFPHLDDQWNYQ
jgi:hypothetical protein